jgi:hypothetical protein
LRGGLAWSAIARIRARIDIVERVGEGRGGHELSVLAGTAGHWEGLQLLLLPGLLLRLMLLLLVLLVLLQRCADERGERFEERRAIPHSGSAGSITSPHPPISRPDPSTRQRSPAHLHASLPAHSRRALERRSHSRLARRAHRERAHRSHATVLV